MSTTNDSEEMHPHRTATTSGPILIKIPYGRIIITSVILAAGSIMISTTIGYGLHFEGVTATRCGPRNNKLCCKRSSKKLTRAKILL